MSNLADTMLVLGGIYNLGFAIFHLGFWRIFRWKEDLVSLTRINRAIMQVLNLRLTFVFLVMAYVSFFHRTDLLGTGLGTALLTAFSLFWFLRMIEQVIFFGLKNQVSMVFTLLFLLGSLIYLMPIL